MCSSSIDDALGLVGRWTFFRTISDMMSNTTSHANGLLTIRAESPTRLTWEERGAWWLDSIATPVRRTLRLIADHDRWRVTFEDGRHFHDWAVDDGIVYLCAPDHYAGRVTHWPGGWCIVWTVDGPHKRHIITTDHRRHDATTDSTGSQYFITNKTQAPWLTRSPSPQREALPTAGKAVAMGEPSRSCFGLYPDRQVGAGTTESRVTNAMNQRDESGICQITKDDRSVGPTV